MPNDVAVLLCGYGGIGRLHALCYQMLPLVYPQLAARPRLVGVVTRSEESAARARQELGIPAATDFEQALATSAADVIDCCAPTGDHAAISASTLRQGKALYCEKPFTADAQESAALIEIAQQQNLISGIHYHFRGIPALQEARKQIEAGALGTLIGFHMRYFRSSNLKRDRPLSWRFVGPGSGVLVDLGSHLIDLTHYLFGPIATVSARTRVIVAERTAADGQAVAMTADDDTALQVELANGGFGTLVASKVVAGAADDIRIEAYGTNGSLCFDTRDPNTLQLAQADGPIGGQRISTLSRGQPLAAIPGSETPTATLQWHLAVLAGFFDAYAQNRPAPISLADGFAVDRVIDAARESADRLGERRNVI